MTEFLQLYSIYVFVNNEDITGFYVQKVVLIQERKYNLSNN